MVEINEELKYKGCGAIVRFKGETRFAPGLWIGLELRDPIGKNNGSVNGISYFDCEDNHGLFIKESSLLADSEVESKAKMVIEKLQEKLYVLSKENNELVVKINEAYGETESLRKALAELNDVNETLLIGKEELVQRLEVLENEITRLSDHNNTLNKEIGSLRPSNDTSIEHTQNGEQGAMFSQHQEEIMDEVSMQLDDSSLLIRELEMEVDRLNDLVSEQKVLETDYQEMCLLNDALKGKVSDLEDLLRVQRDIEKLNLEVEADLALQVDLLKSQLEEKEASIKELEKSAHIPMSKDNTQNEEQLLSRIHILTVEKEDLLKRIEFYQFESDLSSDVWGKQRYAESIQQMLKLVSHEIDSGLLDREIHLKALRFRLILNYSHARIETYSSWSLDGLAQVYKQVRKDFFAGHFNITSVDQLRNKIDSSFHSQIELHTVKLKDELASYEMLLSLFKLEESALRSLKNVIPSTSYEEWLGYSIEFFDGNLSRDIESLEYVGFMTTLLFDIFDSIDSGNTKSLDDILKDVVDRMPSIVNFLVSFTPKTFTVQFVDPDNTPSSKTGSHDGRESQSLQTALDASRLIDNKELRSKVKSFSQEVLKLKRSLTSKDRELGNMVSSNEKLKNEIKSLMNTELVGSNSGLDVQKMYQNAEKRDLIQKSVNSQSNLRFVIDLQTKSFSCKWLDTSLDAPSEILRTSDSKKLAIIGLQLRKAVYASSL
ncbi:hypothetical protein WICPIJ_006311 [Wickerhamomyces pijperi]|uniref:CAP-Gly domain-containing protein n=1 Tax=Wickerhamomyces pijperi TaxID=599730 RepID=A0A9P8Q2B9_WICPI|nr:hypothetical protein WICPIJ_006311 [Wickerhamomyces pijperi]